MSNPVTERFRSQLESLPDILPLVQQYFGAMEGAAGGGGSVLPQITAGAEQAMAGGLDPAERLAGERRIGQTYRSAVAGTAGAGAQMGRFNPRAVRRAAGREAGQRLAPALGELEAAHGKRRMEGLRTGLGALGSVYGPQARAEASRRSAFGELLGQAMGGEPGPQRQQPTGWIRTAGPNIGVPGR